MSTLFEQYRSFIPDFADFAEQLRVPLTPYLRANPRRCTAEALERDLRAAGIDATRVTDGPEAVRLDGGLDRPGAQLEWFVGRYHVQGWTSMLPPRALDVQPGHRVLDMCAAPGSKATQLAAMLDGQGYLFANEPFLNRISLLKTHVERLGHTNVCLTAIRAERFPGGLRFDRVLLDAPCSGEGTERVGAARTMDEAAQDFADDRARNAREMESLYRLQGQLLRRAGNLTEVGGLLVYSTCTFDPRENELALDDLLRERSDLRIEPVPAGLGGEPGLTEYAGRSLDPSLAGCRRYYPHRAGNSWGFFVARLRKVAEDRARPSKPLPDEPPGADEDPALIEARETLGRCGVDVAAALAQHRLVRSGRAVWLAGRDLPHPARLERYRPQNPGIRVFRDSRKVLKPSTAAALELSSALRAGEVVDLSADEVVPFIRGEALERDFPEAWERRGYRFARHGGQVIGAGLFRGGALVGQLPKRFVGMIKGSFSILPDLAARLAALEACSSG